MISCERNEHFHMKTSPAYKELYLKECALNNRLPEKIYNRTVHILKAMEFNWKLRFKRDWTTTDRQNILLKSVYCTFIKYKAKN